MNGNRNRIPAGTDDRGNWLSSAGWLLIIALTLAALGIYENREGFADRKLAPAGREAPPVLAVRSRTMAE